MLGISEDKKFFNAITIKYSPTIFGVLMPVAPVNFKNIPLPVQGLVDSGATNSLISYPVALQANLKIDPSISYHGGGVGSGYDYYKSESVEVDIVGQRYSFKFDILLTDDPIWPCILGQDTIFSLAKIIFKKYRNEFEICFRKDIN